MHLLVFSPYYPPHRGGLETHSDEFNKHLSSQGENITVFTPHLPASAAAQEKIHTSVTVIRFPATELIHNYPIPCFWKKEFWYLWKELLATSPDAVLSRTRFFFPSLMAGYFAWRKKLPWVHVEHGSDFAHFNSPLKNFLGRLYDHTFGKLILKKAHVLIANSEASKNFVRTLSKRADCNVIHRGLEKELIETALPQTELREKYPDIVIVGYVGRLIEGKGVKDLIQAFSESKKESSLLVIIGDGPEQKKLEILVHKLGLEDRVFFLGAQPLPLAMGHLKTWDIFVNPSYTEGIPTSVIEAALLGKAIIATEVGGTNEIISGDGDSILISPHDTQALTKALITLQEDTGFRKQLGEEARKRVAMLFTWESAIQKYQELFAKILKKKA